MSEPDEEVTINPTQSAFYTIISLAVDRALEEWDLTESDVIGVLELIKLEIAMPHILPNTDDEYEGDDTEEEYDSEDEDEDEEI